MTEPEEVFQREVVRRHEVPYAPLVSATEPEEVFQREVLDRHRRPGAAAHTGITSELGGRALADPSDDASVAADRAWLAAMMAHRTEDGR
ncbi:hypothetical protein [Nonomuraea sp. NEAU-A123]|uniref:hypothetical protein n=1 Tax=Nonomuraea sp. NEAU-A123 TaxID=2839649 RepID=UPI001BE40B7D|nr:hypothetical protein [Nonomuraea sp. NEAU-A123]MBT2232526.1 hypothetical protein [Nonomuraea sp. NEAU-A123]